MPVEKGIVVYDPPQEVDMGEWMIAHPDCDFVMERLKNDWQNVRLYAYAEGKGYYEKSDELEDAECAGWS